MSQNGLPVSLAGIMFDISGHAGALSGMPPHMAISILSLDVMFSSRLKLLLRLNDDRAKCGNRHILAVDDVHVWVYTASIVERHRFSDRLCVPEYDR